jgi:hypothetical protein
VDPAAPEADEVALPDVSDSDSEVVAPPEAEVREAVALVLDSSSSPSPPALLDLAVDVGAAGDAVRELAQPSSAQPIPPNHPQHNPASTHQSQYP